MRRFTLVLVIMVALTSCATVKPAANKVAPPAPPSATVSPVSAEPTEDSQQTGVLPEGSRAASATARPLPPKSVDVPTISVAGPAAATQPRQDKSVRGGGPGEQPYQIQVENMPLNEFINLVFGKVLDVSYSVDKTVEARKDTVTLNMKSTVRKDEVLQITSEVLKSYGLGIAQKEGVFFVAPITGQPAKPMIPYFVGNVPETVAGSDLVGLFLQVYYLKPQDFIGLATNLALSAQGRIEPVPGSSMVSIIDIASHVQAAAELIRALDRPSLSNKKLKLYYLKYLPVDTFIGYLAQALSAQGIPVAKTPADPGIMLVPLKQIRAVLAVGLKSEWFDPIGFWQEKLDLRTVSEDEPQYYVYHPRNRRASDLAKLFRGSGGGPRTGQQTDQQRVGTRQEVGPETTGLQPQKTTSETDAEKRSRPGISLSEVSVSVDENTNSLVITATPFQYSKVEEILNKLDLLPRQVLVEVTIGEVTLTGKYQFGIEWAVKHGGNPSGTLSTLGKLGLTTTSGFVYSLVGSNFQAVLNAFAQDNVLKVISTPTLVVLDNQDASIDVGDQVPVLTTQATAAGVQQEGNTSLLQSIQYVKTGVILHMKPTINSQGMLTLLLKQEVSNAETNSTSSINSPIITTREIETSVALRSGSSILLGGLMTNQVNTIVNKVPYLGDVPLLNPLFKTTSRSTTRTELFVQITPHILSTAEEAQDATRNFKDLLNLFK